jgi:hypothetical protein
MYKVLVANGTGKPSTLMKRYEILILLISIRLLPGLQLGGGYMGEAGCTKWGTPDSLVPGTVGYHPNPRIFGNRLVGVSSVGHRSMCLGLPCKGL